MNNEIIKILKNGGIGVLPTDTIYGLVGSALNKKTIKRIYELRQRNPRKPFIILIGSLNDLKLFKIKLDEYSKKVLDGIWPGKVSVVLSGLAFRLPKNLWLRKLLNQTGPLVAPSANPERMPPAKTIKEAKKYFGDKIDFYINKGKLDSLPSTLIQIKNKNLFILRQGTVKIANNLFK